MSQDGRPTQQAQTAMNKLVPGSPGSVTVIRRVTENITTFSAPFARMGRIKIGGRGTAVRLPSGSVALFSPLACTDEAKSTVQSMGPLKYIAALDFEHHLFIGPWKAAYPDATVIGVEGLPEKREKMGMEHTSFDKVFTQSNKDSLKIDPEFDEAFEYEYVFAHGNKELAFLAKRDRTLIQGDLLFNLPALEQYSKAGESPHTGFLTKLMNGINTTQGDAVWQKRFIWYLISAGNRPAFNESVGRIDKWDFERIVPCHGDVMEQGGKGIFRKIMGWHLQAQAQKEGKSS